MNGTFLFYLFGLFLFTIGIDDVRNDFNSLNSEEQLEAFLSKYSDAKIPESTPYIAAAIMRKAAYAVNPVNKLKYFKEGKSMLEAHIKSHQGCIEGRYVRALVQSQIPGILGYSSDEKSDIAYVKSHLANSDIPKAYQQTMLKNLNSIE